METPHSTWQHIHLHDLNKSHFRGLIGHISHEICVAKFSCKSKAK